MTKTNFIYLIIAILVCIIFLWRTNITVKEGADSVTAQQLSPYTQAEQISDRAKLAGPGNPAGSPMGGTP
jgi:hypothetical protein